MVHPGYVNAMSKVGFAHCPVKKHRSFARQQRSQPHSDHGGRGGQHNAQPLTGQLAQACGKNQRPQQYIPAAAQAGAVGQQGLGRGRAHLNQKSIGNGCSLLRNGKTADSGWRKPAFRGGGILMRRAKLT